jgi:hypothetical protein
VGYCCDYGDIGVLLVALGHSNLSQATEMGRSCDEKRILTRKKNLPRLRWVES